MMTSTLKLFMVLITFAVAVLGWITGQYRDRDYLILILILVSATMLTFLWKGRERKRNPEPNSFLVRR